jgi:hypothetical protein
MTKNLSNIKNVLKNEEFLIEVANICDKAYCDGIHANYIKFGKDNPEKVAQNVAALQAVISSIGTISMFRGAKDIDTIDGMTIEILNDILNDNLTVYERSVMLRFSNCAWGSGQGFRTDKGSLGRLTRMNLFDLLDEDEVLKDLYQIIAASRWLLEKLRSDKN